MTDADLAFTLYTAYQEHYESFYANLFRLVPRADFANLNRIRRGFPDVVRIYEEWHNSPTEEEFYKKYQVGERRPEMKAQQEIRDILRAVDNEPALLQDPDIRALAEKVEKKLERATEVEA